MKKLILLSTVTLSLLFSIQTQAKSLYSDENFEISRFNKTDKVILHFKGLIRAPFAQQMIDALKEHIKKNSHKDLEISLDSVGGSIYETKKLIDYLREFRKQNNLITSVQHGSMCASSCVPLFVQGDKRYATSTSAFMFHGVAFYVVTNIPDPEASQIMIDSYLERGIDKDWIKEHERMGVWSTPNETWYNGKELYEDGQGFITKLLNNRNFYKAYNRNYSNRPR